MEFLSLTSDNKIIAKTETGRHISRKLRNDTFINSGKEYKFNRDSNTIKLSSIDTKPGQSKFNINERFSHLETFVDMAIDGHTASVVVCGDPGLGKSYTVLERLESKGLTQDEDYTIHKGYTTPKGLYSMLYENRNGIIIIDDMDSVFKDPTSLNLLKAALDSYSKRMVSWNSVGFIDDGLPKMFEFSGQIIFITNKSLSSLDEAVKSRSLCIDVSMTTSEKIDRMRTVANVMLPEIPLSTKNNVLDFIEEKAEEIRELNFRTFIKASKILEVTSDKRAVEYMLYNS